MAQFESSIVQYSSSVGTVSSLIFNPANTSATTFGSLGSVPTGAVLGPVLVIANQGTANAYIGMGSITAASGGTAAMLLPSGQSHFIGLTATGGTTTNQIWAQTGTVGLTTQISVGLASVVAVS